MRTADKALFKFYLFLFALLAILWLMGCNPVKQVLGDPRKKEIVGRQWEKEHGCVTKTVILEGVDSVRTDTVYNNDFVFGSDSIRIDSFETSITKTVFKKVPVYITKTVRRVDTFQVEDTRRVNLLRQDTAHKNGQLTQLTADKKEERKRGNNYLWLLIGGFALYLATRFIKVKPKWL